MLRCSLAATASRRGSNHATTYQMTFTEIEHEARNQVFIAHPRAHYSPTRNSNSRLIMNSDGAHKRRLIVGGGIPNWGTKLAE